MPTPPPVARSTSSWLWYHELPPRLANGFTELGTGPIAYDDRVDDPRVVVAAKTSDGVTVALHPAPARDSDERRPPRWQRSIPRAATSEPVAQVRAVESTPITVAFTTKDGYELHAFDQDGTARFASIVLHPPGFDDSAAALQLGAGATEGIVVYLRGRDEAYLDELDSTTGRHLARRSFEPFVLHDGPELAGGTTGQPLGHQWPGAEGDYRVVRRGEAIQLVARDLRGRQRWMTELDPTLGRGSDRAVALEHGESVVVVAYAAAAAGATAYVLERASGTLRASGSYLGVGPIGHSRYGNEVELATDDSGHVLVIGHESGGAYVAVLDPSSGRLLGHEIWRR